MGKEGTPLPAVHAERGILGPKARRRGEGTSRKEEFRLTKGIKKEPSDEALELDELPTWTSVKNRKCMFCILCIA